MNGNNQRLQAVRATSFLYWFRRSPRHWVEGIPKKGYPTQIFSFCGQRNDVCRGGAYRYIGAWRASLFLFVLVPLNNRFYLAIIYFNHGGRLVLFRRRHRKVLQEVGCPPRSDVPVGTSTQTSLRWPQNEKIWVGYPFFGMPSTQCRGLRLNHYKNNITLTACNLWLFPFTTTQLNLGKDPTLYSSLK